MEHICKNCNSQQHSHFDIAYLKRFGQCWSCDKKLWLDKKMTTEEFEAREERASNDLF